MTATVTRDLALLPKGHLHLHFEAAIRRETLHELADQAEIEVPPIGSSGGFEQFAAVFMTMISVLSLPGALRRVVIENAEDARNDGVVYLELAVSPQFYAATYGSAANALAELATAASEARVLTGVEVALMVTLDRTDPVDDAIELAQLAAAFADRGVVSVGLANNEVGHPAADFLPAFEIARAAGLKIAPHAGELVGPESVAEALDVVAADRIQHGVRVIEDPALLARLAAADVCLDVCPTSNTVLGLVDALSDHPLPRLLDAGVACSINADDPTIFGPGVLDEYRSARTVLGLSDAQLAACATTSIRFSSASADVREAALAAIVEWLASDPIKEHAQ
jgi:adenosine deaminase